MLLEDIFAKGSLYYKYNPIIQYVIKPTLKLVDAHNHPLRGGFSAALASGVAHYLLLEGISQASDYFLGSKIVNEETKIAITQMPWPVHFCIGVSMLSNLGVGLGKHMEKKDH
ncbi:MAG TPA: hypothetical protein VJH92_00985 [Candidatus Nanoarchaeia archaeon]|nr:hypothetical protein [Candidatus Nanoarchaeia archaeon]